MTGTVNQSNDEQADIDNNEALKTPVKFHPASPHENTYCGFIKIAYTRVR